jgi:hypothetical protein
MNNFISSNFNRLLVGLALIFPLMCVAPAAFADLISEYSIRFFRDSASPNAVGFTPGDRLKVEVEATPNPISHPGSVGDGTKVTATQNGVTYDLVYVNDPGFPKEYNVRIPYNTNFLESWDVKITNGQDFVDLTTNRIGNVGSSEFVRNMSISGHLPADGRTPELSWTFPTGFAPTDIQVRIYDHQQTNASGLPLRIHRVFLSGSTTSYVVPENLDNGGFSTGLVIGDRYTFQVILDQSVGGTLVARSRSFFETVAVNNVPIEVFLPTPVNGVYNFKIDVSPSGSIIIDPVVAVGYEYEIGVGDPNFESVTLPYIGDDIYMLSYLDGGMLSAIVDANIPFTFPDGGVPAFTVTGIETSAGLDPTNTTAFMTTLTFVAGGQFTGTMTPITQLVLDLEEGTAEHIDAVIEFVDGLYDSGDLVDKKNKRKLVKKLGKVSGKLAKGDIAKVIKELDKVIKDLKKRVKKGLSQDTADSVIEPIETIIATLGG